MLQMKEDKSRLGDDEIRTELLRLEGWEYLPESRGLRRVWKFQRYVPTMSLVRTITRVMDESNHHSDINLDSRSRTLTVTTHSEGAVTRADLDFATSVNAVA